MYFFKQYLKIYLYFACSCCKNAFNLHATVLFQDLEHNLADVMRQSFKQCWDTRAKLRLLEVFEGISGRELVQVRRRYMCADLGKKCKEN